MLLGATKTFIVEDDPVFQKIIENRLSTRGVSDIQIFDSGEDVLEALNKRPDFVILDFSLKAINGLDTLKKIKKKLPRTEVVVLTSLKDEKLSKECLENGASEFLQKGDEESLSRIFNRVDMINRKKKSNTRVTTGLVIVFVLVLALIYFLWFSP